MIFKVKEGAKLSCTLGSCQTCLQVPVSHGAVLQGKNEATIADNKAGVNIMPFGTCARVSPPVPCTPVLMMKWLMGNSTNKIRGEMALLNCSILPCLNGGIIKVEKSGQKED
ncbi:DUF4280 domain-containing protein [Anaeromicropila populeti]|uniref:DUF4280 domain-containing protein n=1 Tax=Anaeromicropila populeti TaxID=37658 RepID=A0A1I6HTM3_9FIRM|nr:DUF4280 domain-containing protein [Anaeromicropila populeti]SFR57806.1 protein of unknown function [Anaeromicropila populeti]